MNKKIFLVNNWIVVALFSITLLTQATGQMLLAFVSFILAIKAAQAVLFALNLARKHYRYIFALLVGIVLISGSVLPVTHFLIQSVVLFFTGMEVFVHLVDGALQYRQGKKTWIINILMSMIFFVLICYSLFHWRSEMITTFLLSAIAMSSLFYLVTYYMTREMHGNFTLLNMNAAVYRDAFIPQSEFTLFAQANDEALARLVASKEYTSPEQSDAYVTIYLHTWKPSIDMMGHCDMSYKGKSYSFSNYDAERMKLGGFISVGTIGITSVEEYIHFCTDVENKLVYGYTLRLTPDEVEKMDHFVDQIYANSKPWVPQDLAQNGPAQLITSQTDCEIREVVDGAFRNYFVLGANCVKLIDVMLNHIGIRTKASKALLTPGEYFRILDQNNHDKIMAKRVYWKEVNHENIL